MRSLIAVSALVLTVLATSTSASGLADMHHVTMKVKKHTAKEMQLRHEALQKKIAVSRKRFQAKRHGAFAAQDDHGDHDHDRDGDKDDDGDHDHEEDKDKDDQDDVDIMAPVSNEPQCTADSFRTKMLQTMTDCGSAKFPMDERFKTNTEAKTAWDTFCSSACVSGIQDIVGSNVEVCVHPMLIESVKTMKHMCEKTDSAGEKCGVHYNSLMTHAQCSDHPIKNSTWNTLPMCSEMSGFCEEHTEPAGETEVEHLDKRDPSIGTMRKTEEEKECRAKSSAAVMNGVCDSACTEGLITIFRQVDPTGEGARAMKLLRDTTCMKASDGAFCQTKMDAFEEGESDKATFTKACTDRALLGCYKKQLTAFAGPYHKYAKNELVRCAKRYKNETAKVENYCIPTFKGMMYGVKNAQQMVSNICARNTDGEYCMVHRNDLYRNKCYNVARYEGTQAKCTTTNASCATSLQDAVKAMGCCAGVIQEAYTKAAEIDSSDYPTIPGYKGKATTQTKLGTAAPLSVGADEEEATSVAGDGYLADLAFCGVTGLNQTLYKRCKVSKRAIRKAIGIKIRWSKLKNNAALREKIKVALRNDMANNLGLAPEEIVNDEIVENPNIQVTTAAGRRFQVQQAGSGSGSGTTGSTGSGITYEFEIQASDSESTDSAAATFDTLDSDNAFVMTETQSTTTAECGNDCTSKDGEMTTSAGTNSGATQVFGGLVALVVIFATLF